MKVAMAVVTFFFGYLLVYAAVADKGRFAFRPWEGVRSDAYDHGKDTAAPADTA